MHLLDKQVYWAATQRLNETKVHWANLMQASLNPQRKIIQSKSMTVASTVCWCPNRMMVTTEIHPHVCSHDLINAKLKFVKLEGEVEGLTWLAEKRLSLKFAAHLFPCKDKSSFSFMMQPCCFEPLCERNVYLCDPFIVWHVKSLKTSWPEPLYNNVQDMLYIFLRWSLSLIAPQRSHKQMFLMSVCG